MGALTIIGILLAFNAAAIGIVWVTYKWSVSRTLLEHLGTGWRSLTEAQKGGAYVALLAVGCAIAVWVEQSRRTDTIPEYDREHKVWKFGDYTCRDDCSGHVAGYQWARDHGITDEGDCGGNSQAFIDGCKVWVSDAEDPRDEDG
jgi:hypothetical protein